MTAEQLMKILEDKVESQFLVVIVDDSGREFEIRGVNIFIGPSEVNGYEYPGKFSILA